MTTLSQSEFLADKCQKKFTHRHVRYRFIIVRSDGKTRYDINVIYGDEGLTMTLPFPDYATAYEAYLRIKRGKITPTTLADVIEDMKV